MNDMDRFDALFATVRDALLKARMAEAVASQIEADYADVRKLDASSALSTAIGALENAIRALARGESILQRAVDAATRVR